jgi:hypothetical protein
MWFFNSKRKRITRAFASACKALPTFTTWETLNHPAPQFVDRDGGRFTVVEHCNGILMLRYVLGSADMTYVVSTLPSFLYVYSGESSSSKHLGFRRDDALRFLEKLTHLLNTYASA